MIKKALVLLVFSILSSSVSALDIPAIGASGPVGVPITGVGITGGEGELMSCVQSCVMGCATQCATTSCGQRCGENCVAKCLSGAGITTDTITVYEPDVAAYCAGAATCDQCRNRPAYRCIWAGACVPCTGASCTFSCNYVARKPVTITNIPSEPPADIYKMPEKKVNDQAKTGPNKTLEVKGTMPYVDDPKAEDFAVDPETGELIYVGPIDNETDDNTTQEEQNKIPLTQQDKKPTEQKQSSSPIAIIFRGIGSLFSWMFS